MPRNIHSNYFEDTYVKYECQTCKRSFIVGERLSVDMELSCPYCKALNIEETASASEDRLEDMEMGCLGIYFHIYTNNELMLYTQNEFTQALCEFFEKSNQKEIALGDHNKILKEFCAIRDNIKV